VVNTTTVRPSIGGFQGEAASSCVCWWQKKILHIMRVLRRHEIYLLVEGEEEVMIGNYQVRGAEGQIDWSAG